MNRGSEWHKWDLHFHTPSSYDYEDKSVTNDEIIDGLLAHEVAAVAITDHHVIDVARIMELQRISAGRITILPGIEFLSDARGKEPIHFIGIFPENTNLNFVWEQIKNRTNIVRIYSAGVQPREVYNDLSETCDLIHEQAVLSVRDGPGQLRSRSAAKLPEYPTRKLQEPGGGESIRPT